MTEHDSKQLNSEGYRNALRKRLYPIGKYAKTYPGVSITLLIGYLTLLGYLHLIFLLRHFNIDGSHFVQASDFLLILTRAIPAILALLLIYAIFSIGGYLYEAWIVARKRIRGKNKRLSTVSVSAEILWLLFLLPILSGYAGNLRANSIYSKGECVVLGHEVSSELGISQKVKIIESTSQYMFLLTTNKRAIVVEKNSVLPLEPCSTKNQGRSVF